MEEDMNLTRVDNIEPENNVDREPVDFPGTSQAEGNPVDMKQVEANSGAENTAVAQQTEENPVQLNAVDAMPVGEGSESQATQTLQQERENPTPFSEKGQAPLGEANAKSAAAASPPPRVKKSPGKRVVAAVAGLCLVSAIGGGLTALFFSSKINSNDLSLATPTTAQVTPVINTGNGQANFPVEQIAKNLGPAVVGVTNFQANPGYFGNSSSGLQAVGSGSGFIVDAQKGYIVTNDHVIAGAQKITVSLADGRNLVARLVGADPRTDLAVLQIPNAKNLTAVQLGNSATLQVGEPVVAIGNPGGNQFARSVTTGVISATDRTINLQGEDSFNLIQTDAAINPGNSGGPLVDYQGKVIGITSAKYAQPGFEGMGFAIPISNAWPTIQQLIKSGVATHPALLVTVNDQYDSYAQNNNKPLGAYIAAVTANGPAAKAGIQQGDVITKINNTSVQNSADLVHALYQYNVGDKVSVTFIRHGQTRQVQVTLGEIGSNQ